LKPIEDTKDSADRPPIVALTGDGHCEKKILNALAHRYDGHDRTLLLPTKPPPIGAERRTIGRFSGLSAFQVIKTYVSRFKFTQYLVILDIEHFTGDHSQEDMRIEIERALENFGFLEHNVVSLNDRAYRVKCRVGAHLLRMNTVVSGFGKRVEENISELLKLEHGLDVRADKGAIRNALNQLNLDLHDLLTNCSDRNLSTAFKGLVAALLDFENQDC